MTSPHDNQMDDGWRELLDSLPDSEKPKREPLVKCGYPADTDAVDTDPEEEARDLVEDALQGHQTALTILDQMGTLTRALTCARDFVSLPYGYERDGMFYRGGVQFRMADGVSAEVLLNGLDLYEVSLNRGERKTEANGIYFDQLAEVVVSAFDEVRA